MIKNVFDWIRNNPNRFMFLIPIILVAGISISHVVAWYDISNPINWAIYLSMAIEVGAMTALVAATNRIKGGVWVMFGIVTFVQVIGNVFYSYKEIDENGELFKDWVELSSPFWELLGTSPTDTISMKRWLSVLSGGLLPIISLTSLHFFVNYEASKKPEYTDEYNNDEYIDEEEVFVEKEQDDSNYVNKKIVEPVVIEKKIEQISPEDDDWVIDPSPEYIELPNEDVIEVDNPVKPKLKKLKYTKP
jgi:hypothetical protein